MRFVGLMLCCASIEGLGVAGTVRIAAGMCTSCMCADAGAQSLLLVRERDLQGVWGNGAGWLAVGEGRADMGVALLEGTRWRATRAAAVCPCVCCISVGGGGHGNV